MKRAGRGGGAAPRGPDDVVPQRVPVVDRALAIGAADAACRPLAGASLDALRRILQARAWGVAVGRRAVLFRAGHNIRVIFCPNVSLANWRFFNLAG